MHILKHKDLGDPFKPWHFHFTIGTFGGHPAHRMKPKAKLTVGAGAFHILRTRNFAKLRPGFFLAHFCYALKILIIFIPSRWAGYLGSLLLLALLFNFLTLT